MLDRSSVIGLVMGSSLILTAVILQGEVATFISLSSLLIVSGGVLAATMVHFSFDNIRVSFIAFRSLIRAREVDLRTDLELLCMFARRIRINGMLSMDREIEQIEYDFMQNGLQLGIDGFKKESLNQILIAEIKSREAQMATSVRVLEAMAAYSPAFGMIGTVIGLVLMLQNISDPQSLGAGLAVALITTLYGTILSNMFFGPLAGKLEYLSKMDVNRKEMVRIGILSIVDGENPRVMEKRMLIFVEPDQRAEYLRHHESIRSASTFDDRFYEEWTQWQQIEWPQLRTNLELG